MTSRPANAPLVSILCICKNGAGSIQKCLDSVFAQDYPHVEFVVQDGASTDGTLEILQSCGERIKLVSEPDRCGEEGLFRALRRSSGEYIGFCLDDEALQPHAVSWAVARFDEHPEMGALHGEQYYTDLAGNITGVNRRPPFDFSRFICCKNYPPMGAAFFKRSALEAIGLHTREWPLDCGDMEIWLELGLRYPIRHFPEIITCYALGPHETSMSPKFIAGLRAGTIRLLQQFFSNPATPPQYRDLKDEAFGNLHLSFAAQFMTSDVHRQEFTNALPVLENLREAVQFRPDPVEWRRTRYELLDYAVRAAKGFGEVARACLEFLLGTGPESRELDAVANLLQALRGGAEPALLQSKAALIFLEGQDRQKAMAHLNGSMNAGSGNLTVLKNAVYLLEQLGEAELSRRVAGAYLKNVLQHKYGDCP